MDEGLIHMIKPRAEYEEEVNMVSGCPGEFRIFDVEYIMRTSYSCMLPSAIRLVRWNTNMDLAKFAVETPEDVQS